MSDMGNTLLVWAAILGAIAAGSMILGAIVGITQPMSNATVGVRHVRTLPWRKVR